MLVLKEKEVCPYGARCPYASNGSNYCQGTNPLRTYIFNCTFVDDSGNIAEGKNRVGADITGKMIILNEDIK